VCACVSVQADVLVLLVSTADECMHECVCACVCVCLCVCVCVCIYRLNCKGTLSPQPTTVCTHVCACACACVYICTG